MGVPNFHVLRGLPYEVAECYGKPHVGCKYDQLGDVAGKLSMDSYHLEEGARCAICGRPATNCHHQPPKSKRMFAMETDEGLFVLRPALIALCGSGTTGCHNGFHGGSRYTMTWKWLSSEFGNQWWSGELLASGKVKPHDNGLYLLGYWQILDKKTNKIIEVRR